VKNGVSSGGKVKSFAFHLCIHHQVMKVCDDSVGMKREKFYKSLGF